LKTRILLLFLIFFALCAHCYAKGAAQQSDSQPVTQNDNWILCLTEFDAASLPAEKANISETVIRELAKRMSAIDYRARISPEYAYYEQYAHTRERSRAAAALNAKLEERSALIYRGDAGWIYRRNAEKLDTEIEALRAALSGVESSSPLINSEPSFTLSAANLDNIFPSAPSSGNEYRFCASQDFDAFLSGAIADFYGRYLLTIRLYAVFTRSYIWEDSIIFSNNDLEDALSDLSRRLLIVLSGNVPASVTVNALPSEALILINGSFAGRGEAEKTDYPPGLLTVTASAEDHQSVTYEIELLPGETVDINFNLNSFEYGNAGIFSNIQGSVYHGALYLGQTPLTVRLPAGSMEYLELLTEDSSRVALVFDTPLAANFYQPVTMTAVFPLLNGGVEKDRTSFYWAFGGTWIAGIAAWISYYTFAGADAAIMHNYSNTGTVNQNFYNNYQLMNNIYIGSIVAAGAAAVYGIYRLIMYIYNSTRDNTPVLTSGRS